MKYKQYIKQTQDLLKQHNLSAYVLPKNDEFMSSYLSKSKDRLFKITNFSGSAGTIIIFADMKPVFITDSRYKLQA
jgi:Xaa-Pro aminopeptidase